MITPLVTQEAWGPVLRAARPWRIPDANMLVIAPHPDDETLACAGLIAAQTARGNPIRIAAVTDGENAYENDDRDLAEIRREEQIRALAKLGVDVSSILRLGLPDSELASYEKELVKLLRPHVQRSTHILAPWLGDFHPDHEVCGRAAQQLARDTGATLTFYFFWTWHRGTPDLLAHLPLRSFELTRDNLRAKADALSQHHSQLEHTSGEPILPEYLLWPARHTSEIFVPA